MPDRDVFRSHVRHGWQRCARLLFSVEPLNEVVCLALSHASSELGREGCPALHHVIQIIQARAGNTTGRPVENALSQLEELERRVGGDRTRLLVREAKKHVVTPPTSADAVPISIAKGFVVAYVEGSLSPPGLIGEVVESGRMSFPEVMERRQGFQRLVEEAPGTFLLAKDLLSDPTGGMIKVQRAPKRKQALADLLFKPLSAK